jgi:hypothetical protein
LTIARPIATRCLCPPDICPGFLSSCSSISSTRAASATRASISSFGTFAFLSPNAMFSRTVMCG